MPIGALTLTAKKISAAHQALFADAISLVGDASYSTGGTAGLEAALQLLTKDAREILDVRSVDANGGYDVRWDLANKKLMVFTSNGAAPAALAQVPNATNLSAVTFKLLVLSR